MFYLFKCQVCLGPVHGSSFPLCSECLSCLHPCPPICKKCGNPGCFDGCSRPWVRRPEIDSYFVRYLLGDAGLSVIRSWKKRGGLLFSRRVLKSDKALIQKLQELNADVIIPMPQSFHRSWQLNGSPAGKIANWISQELGVPVSQVLEYPLSSDQKRQAMLSAHGRLENKIQFGISEEALGTQVPKRVILVDDIMTTGRTLSVAAKELKSIGVQEVHAFALGFRVYSTRLQ